MGKYEELRLRILEGKWDANINFDELRDLLEWPEFEERIRSSHHIFRRHGVRELINLQQEGSKAVVSAGFPATAVIAAHGLMAIGALHCAYDRKIPTATNLCVLGIRSFRQRIA